MAIFAYNQLSWYKSVHFSAEVLLDPENVGVTFGISLYSVYELKC